MAKNTLTKYQGQFNTNQSISQDYSIECRIGRGYTYSKFNTFFHYINIIDNYWANPDINYISIFSKDVRSLLSFVSQKIIFSDKHDYYHYGSMEQEDTGFF